MNKKKAISSIETLYQIAYTVANSTAELRGIEEEREELITYLEKNLSE